ncbi:hypothetical protein [Sporosalibacterium faouarense]|uniref:hypothetical protein n=1 Tax=Sporosalibacterium faouarense TaxID=516123 RepID=UPI00141C7986|nr:hypothetical protein [Sporosalibacterium faouarense]MTI46712.1 hypothetical protein [Bacillota bacterium]
MKSTKKVLIYFFIYAVLLQFGLKYLIPGDIIYSYRLKYDLVKDRPTNIEAVLENIKDTIKREKLDNYVIILGDSVGYSNPGPSDASLAYYFDKRAVEEDKKFRTFNLSMPAMQTGDIYTVLLKLKEYEISTDHVIINLIYSGFVERDPTPPIVYWLQDQLKELDKEAFMVARPYYNYDKKWYDIDFKNLKNEVVEFGYENISIFKYKDYVQLYLKNIYAKLRSKDVVTTVQPWTEKSFLVDLLQEPMYQKQFSDKPFVMDDSNPNIYFLDKIIEKQKGKDTLIFMAGINEELLKNNVESQDFQENLKRVNRYFEKKEVNYIDYNGKIDTTWFSDHVHLTPNGYKHLADSLWKRISNWNLD